MTPAFLKRFNEEYRHEVTFQRRMLADMKDKDLEEKVLPDRSRPGEMIGRGEAFDRYAQGVWICMEAEERAYRKANP